MVKNDEYKVHIKLFHIKMHTVEKDVEQKIHTIIFSIVKCIQRGKMMNKKFMFTSKFVSLVIRIQVGNMMNTNLIPNLSLF